MGKQFRVIEGGRSPKKDGLNEISGQAIMAELQNIDGVARPRYARPQLNDRSFDVTPASSPNWRKPERFDQNFLLFILLAAAACFSLVWESTAPVIGPALSVSSNASDSESASFGMCHSGGGVNCVVDGDTLYYQGSKIRIADIDTPETHPPRCEAEAIKGAAATQRLQQLVSAGPFTLEANPDGRDEDRYGRKLRIVTRGGESLGGVLVGEGLARWYAGGRQGWC